MSISSGRSGGTWSSRSARCEPRPLVSFSAAQWHKLKAVTKAIDDAQRSCLNYRAQLEEQSTSSDSFLAFNLASECENLRILNEMKKRNVDKLKRILLNKSIALRKLNEQEFREESRQFQLSTSSLALCERRAEVIDRVLLAKRYLNVFAHLLARRRRDLLEDVFKTFNISKTESADLQAIALKKKTKKCSCAQRDMILQLHLPPTTSIQGHDETELAEGLGYATQMMNIIAFVLEYPLRYPMQAAAAKSGIRDPRLDKVYPMFGTSWRWRADPEKLEKAVTLFSRNVAQLIAESEMSGRSSENILNSLVEWAQRTLFRRINAPTDSQFDTDSPIEVRILVREFTALDLNAPEEVSSEGVPNVDLQN